MNGHVKVFDTSLRDGEQAAGKMMPEEKLRIARILAAMHVDVIEAGFPIASPGDFRGVEIVAGEVRDVVVCALARALDKDIAVAGSALRGAARPRIHTFIATSPLHMRLKLRMSPEMVLRRISESVRHARTLVSDVEFSAEDATRSDVGFLIEAYAIAIAEGATTINVPDTVGAATPRTMGRLIHTLRRRVLGINMVTLSVHCHNDLGLGVANSLAAIGAGARQVEGCFLGIGERAGNTALEQVVVALGKISAEYAHASTRIDATRIGEVARAIAEVCGYSVWPHAPLVGKKVFAHSSGIHADGVQKDPATYEIVSPEEVGWRGVKVELRSHMGKSGLSAYLTRLGYEGDVIAPAIYDKFVGIADAKRTLSDDDLRMLAHEYLLDQEAAREQFIRLEESEVQYAKGTATISLSRAGRLCVHTAEGNGAIDAVWKAVALSVPVLMCGYEDIRLTDFQVVKGAGGSEANAWVIVRVKIGGKEAQGSSSNPDTIVATAKAFVRAINHLTFV